MFPLRIPGRRSMWPIPASSSRWFASSSIPCGSRSKGHCSRSAGRSFVARPGSRGIQGGAAAYLYSMNISSLHKSREAPERERNIRNQLTPINIFSFLASVPVRAIACRATLLTTALFIAVASVAAGADDTLGRISTRGQIQTGDNILVSDVIVTGSEAKQVLLRLLGPSLGGSGV